MPHDSLSVTERCLSSLRWLSDDLTYAGRLLRSPFVYARWHTAADRAQLRAGGLVWILATDVAEVYVAVRFAEELRRRRPGLKCIFSVADRAASRVARSQVHPDDIVTYIPLPLSATLWRALSLVRPEAVIAVMSAENFYLLRLAKMRGVPVAWVAAETTTTLAERLQQFWPRFDLRRIIDSVDVLSTNTRADRDRLVTMGFDPARILVTGPAKYDAALPPQNAGAASRPLLDAAGIDNSCPIFLGGSLADGEDEALLSIFPALKAQFERLVLVLAPRTVSRAPAIAERIAQLGLRGVRRSQIGHRASEGAAPPDVLLIDTIGDLKDLYSCATVVFVGRSLTDRTGSNFMEPAGRRKAIVIGPRFEHFEEEIQTFLSADAVRQVPDAEGLREAVAEFLADPALRRSYEDRAYDLVTQHAGAMHLTMEHLERHGFFRAAPVSRGRPRRPNARERAHPAEVSGTGISRSTR